MEEPIFSVMQRWIADEVEHYMGLHLQEREARRGLLTIK
jgi:hypothetical protein